MKQLLELILDRLDTPIGELQIVSDREGSLCAVHWSDHEASLRRWLQAHYGKQAYRLDKADRRQDSTDAVARYFAGELGAIDALPVRADGTAFQNEVWNALRTIPCGATVSYARLAQQIRRPAAVRAVGLANGANPVAVVVPCHRVIGADGSLTGYGGGIERKSWLLRHEGAGVSRTLFPEAMQFDLR